MSIAGPPQGARTAGAAEATPVSVAPPPEGAPMTETVRIRLDDRPHAVPVGSTLADLVAALGHAPEAVGTAVNGEFIARGARAHALQHGDAVVLFQPIVGG